MKAGFYEVEILTKDKDGNEVKDIQYLELYDSKNNNLTRPEYLWTKGSNPIEPGDKTTIQVGSSATNVFLVQQITKNAEQDRRVTTDGDINFSFATISAEKKSFDFSATEADRGGYGVTYFFIKDNRFYQYNDIVHVPWSNKELRIEYATFRDKTLPGSEEKWKVKISGYKGEKLAAEMLASMYDASLDQFKPHAWQKPDIWKRQSYGQLWNYAINFQLVSSLNKPSAFIFKQFTKQYDQFKFYNYRYRYQTMIRGRAAGVKAEDMAQTEVVVTANAPLPPTARQKESASRIATDTMDFTTEGKLLNTNIEKEGEKKNADNNFQPRKNFNETAFFFPDLRTDAEGNIEFSFTAPEALTRWKLQTLAHTKDLAFGLSSKEMVTQKELMVQPNTPRFLREGDKMELSAKVVNLSDKPMSGLAELQLLDAATNEALNKEFKNLSLNKSFTIPAGQSAAVQFAIEVPASFSRALVWRIVAKAGNFSDGEEAALPVLTNRMLVTETMPLPMRGSGTKTFTFEKLLQSANSKTLAHHSLAVEYTSNPAWYAVQALPYLDGISLRMCRAKLEPLLCKCFSDKNCKCFATHQANI